VPGTDIRTLWRSVLFTLRQSVRMSVPDTECEILNNKLQVDDLYFGFPIARSHSPIKIFDAMLTAANYTQKRLGGTILDMQRQEFDFKRNQTFIQNIVNDLATKDLKPGSEETLNIFQDETAAYWKARALKFQDTRLTELSTNTTNT